MNILRKTPTAFYILACYTILSGYFAFERILNSDSSYYLFHVLNFKTFWLPEYRWGDVFSQIPVSLFMKVGASLESLIYIYSLTFPLQFLIIALICEYYLKVREAALTLALAIVTGIAFSFFHPVTETYQALAFGILLYATLVSERFRFNSLLYYGCNTTVALVCFVSHPVSVFIIGFVALFSFISKQIKLLPFLFMMILSGLAVLLRLIFTPAGTYDTAQYSNFYASIRLLSDFGSLHPVIFLKLHVFDIYFSSMLLIGIFGLVAFKSKNKLLFFASLICSFGFAIIGILTFAKGDLDMMMEKTFMPSIFMLLLPFCFLAYRNPGLPKRTLTIVITLMAFMGFRQIYEASFIATKRLEVLTAIADRSVYPKLIAEVDDFNEPSLRFNYWSTFIDSYFIAKCRLNKEFTLCIVNDKHSFKFNPTDTTLFLGSPWRPHWNKKLINPTYFNLPPVGYQVYGEH